MDVPGSTSPSRPWMYTARFEGGPHHASARPVRALPSGWPPDFLAIQSADEGVYALAGAASPDGRLPYLWMTWAKAASLRRFRVSPARTERRPLATAGFAEAHGESGERDRGRRPEAGPALPEGNERRDRGQGTASGSRSLDEPAEEVLEDDPTAQELI